MRENSTSIAAPMTMTGSCLLVLVALCPLSTAPVHAAADHAVGGAR